jgi:hypothetical protein
MPKIPPRPEVTAHPVYQAAMAAQHAAYQLMREVPADRKSDAARLHQACVHMTSYASYAVDPSAPAPARSWADALASAQDARERLEPLAAFAADEKEMESLRARLGDVEKAAEQALGRAA